MEEFEKALKKIKPSIPEYEAANRKRLNTPAYG